MSVRVKTGRYFLKIRVRTSKGTIVSHQLICYEMDWIAEIHKTANLRGCKSTSQTSHSEEQKEPKEINLLIRHREGQLAPRRVRVVGDLVLWG